MTQHRSTPPFTFTPRASALVAGLGLACAAMATQAADFSFSGHLQRNTDVVQIGFSLDAPGDVQMYTDSYAAGLNFDPSLTLWMRSGSDYQRLSGEPADNPSVAAGQTDFDDGITGPLSQGHYRLTLTPFPAQAKGTLLSQGFEFVGMNPDDIGLPIAGWNQPGYDLNADNQKGSFWRVNLTGVTQAAAVPEPGTYVLFAFGLVALWLARRSRSNK
jgi:hypothetical protein